MDAPSNQRENEMSKMNLRDELASYEEAPAFRTWTVTVLKTVYSPYYEGTAEDVVCSVVFQSPEEAEKFAATIKGADLRVDIFAAP